MQNACGLLIEKGASKKDLSFKKCFESYYLEVKDGHKFAARSIIFQIYFCILSKPSLGDFSPNFPQRIVEMKHNY